VRTNLGNSDWGRPILAMIAVLVFAAACAASSRQTAQISTTAADATLDASQEALAPAGPTLGGLRHGDILVWLSSRPARLLPGAAEMDAYLVGTEGQPVTDARVTFDTDMTNMSHGLYRVPAEPAGQGHYVGKVRFLMPGPWRVIAIVERPGQETVQLRFEFTVHTK
jgi:hypothetical protein